MISGYWKGSFFLFLSSRDVRLKGMRLGTAFYCFQVLVNSPFFLFEHIHSGRTNFATLPENDRVTILLRIDT